MLRKAHSAASWRTDTRGVLSRVITRESRSEAAEVLKAWVDGGSDGVEQWRW